MALVRALLSSRVDISRLSIFPRGALISAIALSATMAGLWFLAPICLVPWFLEARTQSAGQSLASGLIFALVYGATQAWWLPSELVRLGTPTLNATLATLLLVAIARIPAIAAFSAVLFRSTHWRWEARIASRVATIFAIDTLILSHPVLFPWSLIGESQFPVLGVAQLASIGGIPLLSSFVVALNACCAEAISCLTPRRVATCGAVFVAWLSLAAAGLPTSKWLDSLFAEGGGHLSVLAIQPRLPEFEKWMPELQRTNIDRVASYTERQLEALPILPDLVIWPESIAAIAFDQNTDLIESLQQRVDTWNVPLILGANRSSLNGSPLQYRNSILWVAPEIGIAAEMDKKVAIPVIESSASFPGSEPFRRLLGGATAGKPLVVESREAAGVLRVGDVEFVPLLCFEGLFPRLAAGRDAPGTAGIVNLADDTWMASERGRRQLLRAISFRAIERRLPLLRVAHGGGSVHISKFGESLSVLAQSGYDSKLVSVSRNVHRSVWPNVLLLLLPVVSGIVGWLVLSSLVPIVFKA